jgi:hypothetical protein
MRKILTKIDHIRSRNTATLDLKKDHQYYHLDGQRFKVVSMGIPDVKCRVTLLIGEEEVDFTIDDLY